MFIDRFGLSNDSAIYGRVAGLFLVNLLLSTVITIYIVIYPADWIVELMEVGLYIFIWTSL